MKRRSFLKFFSAFASVPFLPGKAIAGTVQTAAAVKGIEQPYLWATFVSRVHNKSSPAMLQRLLKLEPDVAHAVYDRLIQNKIITTPNSWGLSQAINPFPQFTLSGPTNSAPMVKTAERKLTAKKTGTTDESHEIPEQIADSEEDSPSVNHEMADLADGKNTETEPSLVEYPATAI